MKTTAPIIPLVRMGGTPRKMLIDHLITASDRLRAAEAAMFETAPHARDYVGDDARFKAAMEQHRIRLAMITSIITDYETIGIAIRR
jgi:hypothetical protein